MLFYNNKMLVLFKPRGSENLNLPLLISYSIKMFVNKRKYTETSIIEAD